MFDFEGYRLWLRRKSLSNRTIERRLRLLANLKMLELTKREVDLLVNRLLDESKEPSWINHHIILIRTYAQFADLSEELKHYKFLPVKEKSKPILSEAEIHAFLNLKPTPRDNLVTFSTYSLFFHILADTGARPGEIAALTVNDVDFGRGVFVLPTSKTNSPRVIPIPPTVEKAVKSAVEHATEYLFTTHKGNQLRDHNWSREFQKRIGRLGIKRNQLTCYALRRGFITEMLDEDINMFAVQRIVGHKKATTTQKYYNYTVKAVKEAILKHPRVRAARSPQERLEAYIEAGKDVVGDVFEIDVVHTKKGMKVEFKQKADRKNV